MIITNSQENKKRIVTAPQSNLFLSNTTNIPSTVISVELKENEEVQWLWTIYPDGQKIVTGYNIIKK